MLYENVRLGGRFHLNTRCLFSMILTIPVSPDATCFHYRSRLLWRRSETCTIRLRRCPEVSYPGLSGMLSTCTSSTFLTSCFIRGLDENRPCVLIHALMLVCISACVGILSLGSRFCPHSAPGGVSQKIVFGGDGPSPPCGLFYRIWWFNTSREVFVNLCFGEM